MILSIGLLTIGVSVSAFIVEIFPAMPLLLCRKTPGRRTGPKVKTTIHVREEI